MPTPRTPVLFDDVFTSAHVRAAGLTSGALLGWRARHEVIELRPGVFVRADADRLDDRRRIFASRAIAMGERPVTVDGAALLYGLPVPAHPHPSTLRDDRHRLVPDAHLVRVHGLLVPSRDWTALQLARHQPLEQALIPLDAALRSGAERGSMLRLAESMRGAPGTAGLNRSLSLADERSESPLESVSRGLMVEADLPAPQLQCGIRTRLGSFRVDFCWPEHRVIGEADGRVKYGDASALWNEKRREDALRELGWHVERWVWDDVMRSGAAWLDRLQRRIHSRATSR